MRFVYVVLEGFVLVFLFFLVFIRIIRYGIFVEDNIKFDVRILKCNRVRRLFFTV